jgi:ankyrin repeat protein
VRGDKTLVKTLLLKGADPNACISDYEVTIGLSLRNSRIFITKHLKKACALMISVHKGFQEIAKLLIESGANVNKIHYMNWTPIICAAVFNRIKILKKILSNGGIVDLSDMTSLMWAARLGNYKAVLMLIDNGANVNAVNIMGATPLMFAIMSGDIRTVSYLIKKGARTNIKTKSGKSPLWLARHLNNHYLYNLIKTCGGRL